jgi:hypothetical protein
MKRKIGLASVGLLALGAILGGCSSGPSTSFTDGWNWGHNSTNDFVASMTSTGIAMECNHLASLHMLSGENTGQWQAGCVAAANGKSL